MPPRPCDLRKLRIERDRRLATAEAQTQTQPRPHDHGCSNPDAATAFQPEKLRITAPSRSLNRATTDFDDALDLAAKWTSETVASLPFGQERLRDRDLTTLRPPDHQTLHHLDLADKANSDTASRRPRGHQELENCNLATLRSPRIPDSAHKQPMATKCSGICALTALQLSIALESASLQPFGCLELQILRLSSLSTTETARICVSSSLATARNSGTSASQPPCDRRELWNSHLSNLAAAKNSGTCAWQPCDRQELRNLRSGSLAATRNSGI